MPYIEKHKSCQPAWPKSILLRVVTIFFQECISEFWMIEEYFKSFLISIPSLRRSTWDTTNSVIMENFVLNGGI